MHPFFISSPMPVREDRRIVSAFRFFQISYSVFSQSNSSMFWTFSRLRENT